MTLNVNGYNAAFKAFADFAQQKVDAGQKQSVARQGDGAIATAIRDKAYALTRSADEKAANNATRTLFMNSVAEMFGGEAKIPESVKKAMLLSDYGKGKPLTARRIMAVKAAIDAEGTARLNAVAERQAAKCASVVDGATGQLVATSASEDEIATFTQKAEDVITRIKPALKGHTEEAISKLVWGLFADGNDRDMLGLLSARDCHAVRKIVLDSGNELRPLEEIEERLSSLKANLDELREAVGGDKKLFASALVQLARFGGKAFPEGVITKMVAIARTALPDLPTLSSKSTPADLLKALFTLDKAEKSIIMESGCLEALGKGIGGEEISAVNSFSMGLIFGLCDNKTLAAFRDALDSPTCALLYDATTRIVEERLPKGIDMEDISEKDLQSMQKIAAFIGDTFRQDVTSVANESLGIEEYDLPDLADYNLEIDEKSCKKIYEMLQAHLNAEHAEAL